MTQHPDAVPGGTGLCAVSVLTGIRNRLLFLSLEKVEQRGYAIALLRHWQMTAGSDFRACASRLVRFVRKCFELQRIVDYCRNATLAMGQLGFRGCDRPAGDGNSLPARPTMANALDVGVDEAQLTLSIFLPVSRSRNWILDTVYGSHCRNIDAGQLPVCRHGDNRAAVRNPHRGRRQAT